MVARLGSEFGADFEKYKILEDGAIKTEAGFMKYLDRADGQAWTRADRNKRVISTIQFSKAQTTSCPITSQRAIAALTKNLLR
jgi:hypothetical protein